MKIARSERIQDAQREDKYELKGLKITILE